MTVVNENQQQFGNQLEHLIDEYRDVGMSYADIVGCLEVQKLKLVIEANDFLNKPEEDTNGEEDEDNNGD